MVKFISIAVSALLALASIDAQPNQYSRLPCTPLNFQDKSADFSVINQLVQVAIASGLLSTNLQKVDPLVVEDKRLNAVPFSVLGVDFTLTPTIKHLDVTGLSTVVPHSLAVTAPQHLNVGVDFNGTVQLSSTVSFEIQQLEKKWWQICWTNILHPHGCPSKVIDVEFGAGVFKPSVATDVLVAMMQCDPHAQAGSCTDLTVNDLISAGVSQKFDGLLPRILRRVKTVSIQEIKLAFDRITELHFHFPTSGPLATALGKKLLGFTTKEVNKKGDLYNHLIETADKLMTTLGNKVIQDKIQPKFGNTCYDQ